MYSEKEIAVICAEHGSVYVSGWTRSDVPFNCVCSCGRDWLTSLKTIRKNYTCTGCRGKYTEEVISKICGTFLVTYLNGYVNTNKPFNCICSCGTSWKTYLSNIRKGQKCSACVSKTNLTRRPSLVSWKNAVVVRDQFECQICTIDFGLEVHHIESYKLYPELASVVDNGITLCHYCHTSLHSEYGQQVGKINLQKHLFTTGS